MEVRPVAPAHRHPIFARVYPYISRGAEKGGAAEHRRALLAGLHGRVIEVGAGHGLNFGYYPVGVTQVLAVEPEPHLRELAQAAAERAPMSVEIAEGVAEALPARDGEFDAAVVSLVLCSVSDQSLALREIARVLRPGGELRFYEHVISNRPAAARLQRALDATIYPPLTGGCHCARDTRTAILDAGFEIHHEERIAFKPSALTPSIPHILGAARRA
ncbi:MAG: class I SAM-dependent methyltransferase [Solirubrobacteraceae bacterium]